MKKCNKCKQLKDYKEFWKSNTSKDGYQYICISCQKERWVKDVTNRKEVRAKYRERELKFNNENIERYLLRIAKKRAKEKGIECTITPQDIIIPEGDICPIRGVKMEKYRGKLSKDSYSLDRVDNDKGYVPGNVRVISWWANYCKSNLTLEQARNLVKYIEENMNAANDNEVSDLSDFDLELDAETFEE